MNLEPEQTMDSSASDNSTAKTVNPSAPPSELFHPPRLGIIHLLAWTAATAVLLKLMMAAGVFNLPSDELPRAMRIYSITTLSWNQAACRASVNCASQPSRRGPIYELLSIIAPAALRGW